MNCLSFYAEVHPRRRVDSNRYPRLEEIPFDSDKKWMAVRYDLGSATRYFVKGALESILPCCRHYFTRSGTSPPLSS
jgi:Ca2+-transporting ATPase